ncbi:MAG: DUF4395 family protein [Candidatus Buchananbacteria bacterium]
MQQCAIYDKSLRFSRATYGVLVLIAFLIHSQWLVLAVSILTILGTFSIKLNIPYQFHALVIKKLLKDNSIPIQREQGELNFVAGMTGALLLIGFLFLYFDKFVDMAWIYILIVDLLIFLACFVGFCVATLMYVLLKKIFVKK